MDEQATFETRAVLGSKRSRLSRVVLLVPALALVATALAGFSGRVADLTQPSAASPSRGGVADAPSLGRGDGPGRAEPPGRILGFDVQPLDEIDPSGLGRDDIVAITGWYLATDISDCPPSVDVFRATARPEATRLADPWQYCQRSGVLFASRPLFKGGETANDFRENRVKNSGLPAVNVAVAYAVAMPEQLEEVGGAATAVVVLGRFMEPDGRCHWPMDCPRRLVVDHIAWTDGS